ncbi:MAG: hypothetical protein QXS92_01540 [Thermofilum sp.]
MAVRWSVRVLRDWVEQCSQHERWEDCARAVEEAYGRWTHVVPLTFFAQSVFRDALLRVPSTNAWRLYDLLVQARGLIPFDEKIYAAIENVFSRVFESPATPENRLHARALLEVVRLARALKSEIIRE